MRRELQVDCDLRVCETWRTKDWSTSNKTLSIQDLDEKFGDKLRLPQYEASFDGMAVEAFALQLKEHDPPVDVSSILLLQWYTKYHPAAAPKKVGSAGELEEYLGDEMRRLYAGFGCL